MATKIEAILEADQKYEKRTRLGSVNTEGLMFQKPVREKKQAKGLKRGKPLKSHSSKNKIDMTILEVQKKIRIKDGISFAQVKKPYCEYCGVPTSEEPHHVESRGSGGPDIKENGIQLCITCHTKAHTGEIKKPVLFLIIAKREKVDVIDLIEGVKQQCV